MKFDIDYLDKFDSMTKYPSILTHHKLGEKGRLLPELQYMIPKGTRMEGTEKVDGSNGRIPTIYTPSGYDYFIGSRDILLTSKDDRIYNPENGMVDAILAYDIEDRISHMWNELKYFGYPHGIYVYLGEVYGGKINGHKHYTNTKATCFSVFDIAYISFEEYNRLMELPREAIASWRDHGGQIYLSTDDREKMCDIMGFKKVPFLFEMDIEEIPTTLDGMMDFLKKYGTTKAGIDACGESEGIVFRTSDRKFITKARKEDYTKTLTLPVGKK
jgi:hypothetical protein